MKIVATAIISAILSAMLTAALFITLGPKAIQATPEATRPTPESAQEHNENGLQSKAAAEFMRNAILVNGNPGMHLNYNTADYTVTGKFRNNSRYTVRDVKVLIKGFNRRGVLIGKRVVRLQGSELGFPPGAIFGFSEEFHPGEPDYESTANWTAQIYDFKLADNENA